MQKEDEYFHIDWKMMNKDNNNLYANLHQRAVMVSIFDKHMTNP